MVTSLLKTITWDDAKNLQRGEWVSSFLWRGESNLIIFLGGGVHRWTSLIMGGEKHCIWCGRCSPSHLTWEGVDSVTPKPGGCSLLVQKLWGNASFWHLLFNMSLQQQYLESCYIIREVALIFGLSNQMTEYESIKSTKMQKHKREKYKNIKTQKC